MTCILIPEQLIFYSLLLRVICYRLHNTFFDGRLNFHWKFRVLSESLLYLARATFLKVDNIAAPFLTGTDRDVIY